MTKITITKDAMAKLEAMTTMTESTKMTYDLVNELRVFADDGYPHLSLEAADRIEQLTADKRFIIEERDRTFALMLARAEKAELERDALREDVEELDFLRHEGGPDSVAAIEADNARLREALAADPWFLGRREWAMHIRFALKGETP